MRTSALKLFVFLFFYSLLTSCSNDEATQQFPLEQSSNISSDDYDVYSVIIKSYNFSTIIIEQKTAFGMSFIDSDNNFINELSEGNPGFEPQMVTTLCNNNQNSLFLGNSFEVSPTIVNLISESELSYIFDTDNLNNDWIQFYNIHPNTYGLNQFSAIAYNSDKTKALVETGFACGPLCGQGTLYYLEKVNGLWVIKKTVDTWIS
jgi:hypothetical protein